MRTLEKCRKHSPTARDFYISLVFPNDHRVLSQYNTRQIFVNYKMFKEATGAIDDPVGVRWINSNLIGFKNKMNEYKDTNRHSVEWILEGVLYFGLAKPAFFRYYKNFTLGRAYSY